MDYGSSEYLNTRTIQNLSFQNAQLGYDDLNDKLYVYIQGAQHLLDQYVSGGGATYTFLAPLHKDASNNVSIDLSNYATKSTTLLGYGITDAKITGSKIQLGSATIDTIANVQLSTVTDGQILMWDQASNKWTNKDQSTVCWQQGV